MLQLMTTALLALVLACSISPQGNETVSSANGRFTLEVTPMSLALLERGVAAPRWKVEARPLLNEFYVADSGKWVAVLNTYVVDEGRPWATLYDAAGKAWVPKLSETLDEEEHQALEHSTCGVGWLKRATVQGDTLVMTVIQGGNRRPTEPPGPTLTLTLDARRGTVTRGPRVPRPGIAELVREHQKEGKPGQAFRALQAKALLRSSRGDRTLCAFFAPFSLGGDAARRREAIEALNAALCEGELAVLIDGPRGDDGDLATLEGLTQRDPAAAVQFALKALRGQRPPTLLRVRAAVLLVAPESAWRWEAARMGLRDVEATVRETTVGRLIQLPLTQEAFSMLLGAAGGDTEEAQRARFGVLRYLENTRGKNWDEQFIEAAVAGRLASWASALVIVGGLKEARGDSVAAAKHYQRAVAQLERQRPDTGPWADAQLWAEAKLRLAQMAAGAGQPELAVRLAKEVLTSGIQEYVAAPWPNGYAGGEASRTADVAARELVDSGGAPVPMPSTTTSRMREQQEMVRQQLEMMRLVKDQRQRQKAQREKQLKEREARQKAPPNAGP